MVRVAIAVAAVKKIAWYTSSRMHPKHGLGTSGSRFFLVFAMFFFVFLGLFVLETVTRSAKKSERPIVLGMTFSKSYASSLGLDWKQAYSAMLDDLNIKRLRIPAYWDDVEQSNGNFDFSVVDWQLDEAAKHNAKVILAVGRKLPRWPECHVPDWAKNLKTADANAALLNYVETAVRRYKSHPEVVTWQVENEPFFNFGECPPTDRQLLKKEVAEVRSIDNRQIMITESGESSVWNEVAGIADILGISTYREVWDKYVGYFYWPITPLAYRERAQVVAPFVDKIIISELQGEPWVPAGINSLPIADQRTLMNPAKLNDNVAFARQTGFSEAYLWGVEWWYYLKTKGYPDMWNAGKDLFSKQNTGQ